MINEICSIYEEYYPYFSVPQEDEYYKLEDIDQAANALYEDNARPFSMIDLELNSDQKAKFNSLKIVENYNSARLQLKYTMQTSWEEKVNSFMQSLSPSNEPELVNELSAQIFNIISKVTDNFSKNYNKSYSSIDIVATPAGKGYRNEDWHCDNEGPRLFLLAALLGPSTLYFVPSFEFYQELNADNRTSDALEQYKDNRNADGREVTKKGALSYLLDECEEARLLCSAKKFSVPQGYATIHDTNAIHRAPYAGKARLLLFFYYTME